MATSKHGTVWHPRAAPSRYAAEAGASVWWHELVWIGGAAVVGFATTAVLAGWLELARAWLVLVHTAAVTAFAVAYVRWNRVAVGAVVARHWRWGIAAGLVAGALLVMAVQREDGAARPEGLRLAWDVLWLGIVYGLVDAVLLSVIPVAATWRAFSRLGWTERWAGKIGVGALAVVASMLVTAAYHLGYPEFQGADVRDPIIGNTVTTLSYIVSGNPIAAAVSHIAMHVAAVFHGAEGTTQLPPHY